MIGGGGRGGLGGRGGNLFSSTTPPPPTPIAPFGLPLPRTLEVGVTAVAGEEEREPGETPGASGSRKDDAMDDSRRREGILDWDLVPGGPSGVFCQGGLAQYVRTTAKIRSLLTDPPRARGVPDVLMSATQQMSWAIPLSKLTRHFLFLRIFRR